MALKWIRKDDDVTSAPVGASRPEQLLKNLAVIHSAPLSAEELTAIDAAVANAQYTN